jgi:integrase
MTSQEKSVKTRLKPFLDDWMMCNASIQRMSSRILNLQKGSSKSVRIYSQSIHDFCRYLGDENADQVLEKFMKTAKKDEAKVRHEVQRYIDAQSTIIAPKTVNIRVCALKRWFKANEFSIHWDLLEKGRTQTVMEDRALDVEELRKILSGDKLSLRDKAFIMLAATTGLRVGTLLTLKVGDVVFDVTEELKRHISTPSEAYLSPEQQTQLKNIAMIRVRMAPGRKLRGQNSFFSFMTSETVKVLNEYFKWRTRSGETLSPGSWLVGKEQPKHSGEPMQIVQMGHHWRRILERNGFPGNGQKWHPLHLHTLRKFHTTQTSTVKGYAYIWRGQKQGEYLDEEYFRPNLIDHVKEFLKVEPKLRVSMTPDMERLVSKEKETDEFVEKLKEQNRSLEERLKDVEKKLEDSNRAFAEHIEKDVLIMKTLRRAEELRGKHQRANFKEIMEGVRQEENQMQVDMDTFMSEHPEYAWRQGTKPSWKQWEKYSEAFNEYRRKIGHAEIVKKAKDAAVGNGPREG